MSERMILSTGGWGMELKGDQQPENQLAELRVEHRVTPQRLAAARKLFEEASLDDFEAVGQTGRRLRHLATGREYQIAQDQPLMERDPRRSGIEFFIVAGDWLHFLRPRGFDAAEVGVPGEILSGELRQAPGGGIRVVDARSGAVIKDGLRL